MDCTIWATGIGLAFLLFLRRLVGYYSTAQEESGKSDLGAFAEAEWNDPPARFQEPF
ncbi:MAG TPA: hypothetical protein VF550_13800 [Polyangia bacterium]